MQDTKKIIKDSINEICRAIDKMLSEGGGIKSLNDAVNLCNALANIRGLAETYCNTVDEESGGAK